MVLKSPQDGSVMLGCDSLHFGALWPFHTQQETVYKVLPSSLNGMCMLQESGLAFGLREPCPRSLAQDAWGSNPWPRPSIRLSSSAKLRGTTHYGVIFLIGPLSSPPHSFRVPPYSVRMEYACKPPPWKCSTGALPHSPMWRLWLRNIMLSS